MTLPTDTAIFLSFKINEHISIRPGQYILLQCENLSTLEWHPFTITDFVTQPKRTVFSLAISVRGDWTGELYQKILKINSEKTRRRKSRHHRKPRKLIFVLDGPFPSPMESIVSDGVERVILIGAGIGVTPFISIFNYILWEFSQMESLHDYCEAKAVPREFECSTKRMKLKRDFHVIRCIIIRIHRVCDIQSTECCMNIISARKLAAQRTIMTGESLSIVFNYH